MAQSLPNPATPPASPAGHASASTRWSPAGEQSPLAHQSFGAGDRVAVLLHGVGGSHAAWNDPEEGLAAALAAAGWRAVAPDLPGYGASPALQPCTLAGMAERLEALLGTLHSRVLVLVGHSMGGMLAQEVAARGQVRADALVLANTSPAFGRPEGEWQQAFLRERFAPLDAGLGMGGLARSLVPSMVAPGVGPERLEAAQRLLAAVPEATYRASLTALVAFDRRAHLPHVRQPVLVLTGEADRTASPEVARRMAEKLPRATLAVLPGAGHLANIEAPLAFNAAVLGFLAALDGSPGPDRAPAGTTRPRP